MGIPADLRNAWMNKREETERWRSTAGSVPVASPNENRSTVKGLTFISFFLSPVVGLKLYCMLVGCRSRDCR